MVVDGLCESDDEFGSVTRHRGGEYGPTVVAEVLVKLNHCPAACSGTPVEAVWRSCMFLTSSSQSSHLVQVSLSVLATNMIESPLLSVLDVDSYHESDWLVSWYS